MYAYIKALHIIFVVTWFAGLFYIVRLFIYATEAQNKTADEQKVLMPQFLLMQRRLWRGITVPSAIITFLLGFSTLYNVPSFLGQTWFWVKLAFVAGLYAYHLSCAHLFKQQQAGIFKHSSFKLRIWNEVATVFLFSIVFLVVVKQSLSWVWALTSILALTALLALGIFLYKRLRSKN